jgi:hypothetical protein
MKKSVNVLMFGVAAILVLALMVMIAPEQHLLAAGPSGLSLFQTAAVGSDPCQNPSLVKSSAPIAVTSATTTNLVTAVTGSYITVCKFQLSVVGTSPTVQFEYGTDTSTACDTGAAALTGAMVIPTTTIFASIGAENDTLRTPMSQELCLVTTGTGSPTFEGYVTYVQAAY